MSVRAQGRPLAFIGCMPRSGSSLLRVILDSHPEIHAGPETGWLCAENQSEELLRDTLARPGLLYVNKAPANLSVRGLAFLEELHGQTGRRILFIHIFRNPFDTICSYLKTIDPPVEAKREFAKDAKTFIAGYRALHEADTIRTIELSYEDLIRNTSRTLGRVCGFLGLSPHADMLRHSELEHRTVNHYSHRNAMFPLFTSSIGQYQRYRERMDDETVELCRELVGRLPARGRDHWLGGH